MPDRSREKTSDKTDRKKISSAVVVSRSFQRVQDKRGSPEQRRERRFRQRSPGHVRDTDRRMHRLHMDRHENQQDRRKKISDRLGPRDRKDDEHAENDKEDISNRLKQRSDRVSRRGSPPSSSNQQRRNVFDRLDPGPPRGRGMQLRDKRMIEVEVNPQDVPRGKRYFMHDDRELPRRQKMDRLRARSRSPVWVHDKFEEYEGEEDQEANAELQNDNEEAGTQEKEINQDPQGDRERHRQNQWRN